MSKKQSPQAVFENRIEIAASPTVLWTYFVDWDEWTEWFPALEGLEWTEGTPWTIGAQFRQTIGLGFPFDQVNSDFTITAIEPSASVVWKGELAMAETAHGFQFSATTSGTRVLVRHEFYGRMMWLARLLFLPRRVRGAYQAALEGLKVYVETGKCR